MWVVSLFLLVAGIYGAFPLEDRLVAYYGCTNSTSLADNLMVSGRLLADPAMFQHPGPRGLNEGYAVGSVDTLLSPVASTGHSCSFFIDNRVELQSFMLGRPAMTGGGDFTVSFWMRFEDEALFGSETKHIMHFMTDLCTLHTTPEQIGCQWLSLFGSHGTGTPADLTPTTVMAAFVSDSTGELEHRQLDYVSEGGGAISAGGFHHLAIGSVAGSPNILAWYVNGTRVGRFEAAVIPLCADPFESFLVPCTCVTGCTRTTFEGARWILGVSSPPLNSYQTDCQVSALDVGSFEQVRFDDLYLFDRTLTPSEVAQLYNASAASAEVQPVSLQSTPSCASGGAGSACSAQLFTGDGQFILDSGLSVNVQNSPPSDVALFVQPSLRNGQCSSRPFIVDPESYPTQIRFSETGKQRIVISATNGWASTQYEQVVEVSGAPPRFSRIVQNPAVGQLVPGLRASLTVFADGFPRPGILFLQGNSLLQSCEEAVECTFDLGRNVDMSDNNIEYRVVLVNLVGRLETSASFRVVSTAAPSSSTGNVTAFAWPDADDSSSDSNVGPIVGAVLGGTFLALFGMCCCVVLAVCCTIFIAILIVVLLVIVFVVAVVIVAAIVGVAGAGLAGIGGAAVAAIKLAKRIRGIKLPKPDFEELAFGAVSGEMFSPAPAPRGSHSKLLEYVVAGGPELARVLTGTAKATEIDDVAKGLVFVFESRSLALGMLKEFVTDEVAASTSEGTLFRQNSPSSKMFNTYARVVGLPYAFYLFALPVNQLQHEARKADAGETDVEDDGTTVLNMEVDPSKLQDAGDSNINTLTLWLVAEKMLNAIMRSTDRFPPEFTDLLQHVRSTVLSKYTEVEAFRAMGGFLFLRFLCPALMAPHVYGLLADPPTPTAQRQLILLAKVFQNLANGTLPGQKEAYMKRLNSFITDNRDRLDAFYTSLTHASGESVNFSVPDRALSNSLGLLHVYFAGASRRLSTTISEQISSESAAQFDEIVSELGDPPRKQKSS